MDIDLVGKVFVIALAVGIVLLLGIGLLLILVGTITKTRFGINFRQACCAECDTPAPRIRHPENLNQRLWGGWTCKKCGCEMDKWGNPV